MEEHRKEMNGSMDSSKVEIGVVSCASNASNTGSLAANAALELVRELGEKAGICSLPAIATNAPRQMNLVKSIPTIVAIDGCHNECARKILANAGIEPLIYVNLEHDLGFKKEGPFTTFNWNTSDVTRIVEYILDKIQAKGGENNG